MPDLSISLSSSLKRPFFGDLYEQTSSEVDAGFKKNKSGDPSESSSSSIDGAAVSEASQALSDLNKQLFNSWGKDVFY